MRIYFVNYILKNIKNYIIIYYIENKYGIFYEKMFLFFQSKNI